MFHKYLAIALMAVCSVSFAAQTTIDISGMSDAQVAELKAHAATTIAKNAAVPAGKDVDTMVALASTWGQQAATAAEGFARALNIAAKELGVTVNDFLQTDAGKLTALLIVWKVAGAALIKALYGVLFVSVGLTMVRVIYVRLFTKEYVSVPYKRLFGIFEGTRLVRVPKSFGDLTNDGEWLAFWVMIALTIAVLASGAAFF